MPKAVDHSDRAHSNLGASSRFRWRNCPYSIKLLEQYPQPESPAAAEGTEAHELGERVLRCGLGGEPFPTSSDPEMLEHVTGYANAILEIYKSLKDPQIAIEERVCASSIDKQLFGTSDCIVWEPFGELHIFDLKYGKGMVEVKDNWQALQYMLAAIETLNLMPTAVTLHIYQPRKFDHRGPHRQWRMEADALDGHYDQLKNDVDFVKENPEACNAGDWCKWCATTKCTVSINNTRQKILSEFDLDEDFDDNNFLAETPSGPPPVQDLSIEQLSNIVSMKKVVSDFLDKAEGELKDRLMGGDKSPFYKVVGKVGKRSYVDKTPNFAKLAKAMGKKPSDFMKQVPMSMTQVEALAKKAPKDKREFVMELFNKLVKTPEAAPSVVPMSDPAQEWDTRGDFEIEEKQDEI